MILVMLPWSFSVWICGFMSGSIPMMILGMLLFLKETVEV